MTVRIVVGMAEYAPTSLRWLGDQVVKRVPSAKLSGIVGDPAHTYGYHRSRSRLPSSDYSVKLAADRGGDPNAASAIDITLSASMMRTVTKRFMDVARDKSDPRRKFFREFFGTLDGSTVTGWDTHSDKRVTSDDSHLWHVHVSVYRKYATSQAAAQALLTIFTGEEGDDVPKFISMGAKRTREMKPRSWVTAFFDVEYADAGNQHAEGWFPTILRDHSYFTAVYNGTVTGMSAGGRILARFVEVRKSKGKWVIAKTYPAAEFFANRAGRSYVTLPCVGTTSKNNRLRVQVYADQATEATLSTSRVKLHFWPR